MSVAAHLGIRLQDYDVRIRTFIPGYDEMIDAAAAALDDLDRSAPLIVDLGIGSGALAARCLARARTARVIGIDEDAGMLEMARQRLPRRLKTVSGNFLSAALPRCDVIVASLALHHVPTRAQKTTLYRRCAQALSPRGVIVIADCCLASTRDSRARHRAAWRSHLKRTYSAAEATAYFRAWAKEDKYFTLADELAMLKRAGFTTEVRWRRKCFAVIAGRTRTG
jgi:trans-aconitate methyltransferase